MKEVIVSIYDGGYNWSIHMNNRIYFKEDIFTKKVPIKIKNLYHEVYSNNSKSLVLKKYNIDRLIICEDGAIEIYNK